VRSGNAARGAQDVPWLAKMAWWHTSTTMSSMSGLMSANTMLADLPPSSSVHRLRLASVHSRCTTRPVGPEPVNETLSTSGCLHSAAPVPPVSPRARHSATFRRAPVPAPEPGSTDTTPGGKPASRTSAASRSVDSGVWSAGLTISTQPVASAGP
jgi:hypothetical protein